MGHMVYVHLAIAGFAVLGTLTAILPVRREPFATPEFFSGFLIPELAGQFFLLYGVLAWGLSALHAGRGTLGHVALGLDAAVVQQLRSADRSKLVMQAARVVVVGHIPEH